MPAHIALSIAMAFVSNSSDNDLGPQLDAANLGSAEQGSVGTVISCYSAHTRVPMQALVTISGSSLPHDQRIATQPDCDGALELALAELEHVDAGRRQIVTDLPLPKGFARRAAAENIEIISWRSLRAPVAPAPTMGDVVYARVATCPKDQPDHDHSSLGMLGSLALLGVTAALARRAG